MKTIVAVLVITCATHQLIADPISINIDFGADGTAPEAPFTAAGDNGLWNNIGRLDASPKTGFLDVFGNGTALALSSDAVMAVVTPGAQPFTGNDEKLLGDYVCSMFNTATLQLTGLSSGTYQLHFYFVGRQDYPQTSTSRVVGNSATHTATGIWAGSYSEGSTHTTHDIQVNGMADIFSVELFSPADACINGMQIQAVPEPGTLSLLALASGTLFFTRRKKERKLNCFK